MCLLPAINPYAYAKIPIQVVAGLHKYGYALTVNPIISLLYLICALGWLTLLMWWIGINDTAKTLGASTIRILFQVVLPLAFPSIFTCLRLGAGMALRVLVAAKMIAIRIGIGALLIQAEKVIPEIRLVNISKHNDKGW